MTAAILLTIYCGSIIAASLAGGYLPLLVRLTHRHLEMAISFVSGVILGVGVLHLLPHAVHAMHDDVEPAMAWMLGGFLLMFFLDRFFHFHLHETPAGAEAGAHAHCDHAPAADAHHHAPNADAHVHEPGQPHAHEPLGGHIGGNHPPDAAPPLKHAAFSWSAAAVGMTIHSIVEGIALAAAVDAELHENTSWRLAGLGAFLAIVLHKPLDSLTVGTLMAVTDNPRRSCNIVNALFALAAPAGVMAYYLFSMHSGGEESPMLGPALAFAAGAFVCIASSDLLPELHFHSHDRVKLSACLLLGIALAVGLVLLEHHGEHSHDHGHGHSHNAAHDQDHEPAVDHDRDPDSDDHPRQPEHEPASGQPASGNNARGAPALP